MSLFGNGLFGIERYSFETEKKSSDIEGRGEQLQTIKQQIRERRKSKDDPSIVKSKKKRKKLVESRESVVPSSSDIGISIDTKIGIPGHKASKKHKVKRKKDDGCSNELEYDIGGADSSSPSKNLATTDQAIDKVEIPGDDDNEGDNEVQSMNSTAIADDNVDVEDVNLINEDRKFAVEEELLTENDTINGEGSVFPVIQGPQKVKPTTVHRSLPRWLNEPTHVSASVAKGAVLIKDIHYLSDTTQNNLEEEGIQSLFPIQNTVIPEILSSNGSSMNRKGFLRGRDICVQAPTGSGKTLAYVLPIIELLSPLVTCHLSALIVLPSKDLAKQVKQVFDSYNKKSRLKIALVSGLKSFTKEQKSLVKKTMRGYRSTVDIVVCTPGRLVDHLKQTEGFTLKDLKYLVVDEADRLLSEDYSNWIAETLNSVEPTIQNTSFTKSPLIAASCMQTSTCLRKFLFSATLTQNPEKLASLRLHLPLLITTAPPVLNRDIECKDEDTVEETRYTLPESLEEEMAVVEEDEKPLVLLYLMLVKNYSGVLCFTKSVEATHRLHLLIKSFGSISTAEFSSSLNEVQRKGVIRDFSSGKINLLISSDAMARGLDLDVVNVIVNYDMASNVKTYIHRVGRTARAGSSGTAITILTWKEVYHFKKMSKKLHATSSKVKKLKISNEDLHQYDESYEEALRALQEAVIQDKKQQFNKKTKFDSKENTTM